MEKIKSIRIEALDIFRALTMFLMLFVNDIPGLKDIPHWLRHAAREEDMLGFSDTIFPAFLFAMGMAIPYAIQNRLKKGDSMKDICIHIFWRTVALVAMGLFTVNLDSFDSNAAIISYPAFALLMVLAFFLIWSVYPKAEGMKRYTQLAMKGVGIVILLFLFFIYKGVDGQAFSPQWWGILGLIGWTYLVCAVIFLFTRENLTYNGIALFCLIFLSILSTEGVFSSWAIMEYIPGQTTLHAFGMAGLFAGLTMQKYGSRSKPKRFFSILVALGAVMLIAAVASHQFWIISKIQATPTWLFYCCAIFFPFFGLVYWLTDVQGKSNWFAIIKPAGTVTLTCYIIPYAWYAVQNLLQVNYPEFLLTGVPGLIKSLVFSLLIIGVAWLLMKAKIRLKV